MQRNTRVRPCLLALPLLVLLVSPQAPGADDDHATALFAGGCFWCVEEAFDAVDGVVETTSGFAGGHLDDPTYGDVVEGDTGHYETVRVVYDPEQVAYEELLHAYWRNIDPLDAGGQFCDRGEPYRAAIFVGDESERRAAEASKAELVESGRFDDPVVTEILDRDTFHAADEYHQDYYQKRPLRYRFYVTACGRYDRLEEVWGDEARPGKD